MTIWICSTCGVEHPDTGRPPRGTCRICADDRQWVPVDGQHWTTAGELDAEEHRVESEELRRGLHRFHRQPSFGIGQWSHLVRTPDGNLLWDPPNHLAPELVAEIEGLGGLSLVVASHPHMFGCQVGWSRRFGDVPVLVHSADREWVQRDDPVITEWRGVETVLPGVTLIEVGGHFPGAAVAHVTSPDGRGDLLVGDSIMPTPATGWVTFLRSYPNGIPLSPALVRRIVDALEPYEFDRMYGLAGRAVLAGAKDAVRRSAERYIAWVSGENDHLG